MTDELDRYLAILGRAVVETKALVRKVNVTDRTSLQKRLVTLVLNELAEKGESVKHLGESNLGVGIEVIARSAFESYIDIIGLFGLPKTYPFYMLYMSNKQQVRCFKAFENNPDSSYSKTIAAGMPKQLGITIADAITQIEHEMSCYRSKLTRNYFYGDGEASNPKSKVNSTVAHRAKLAGKSDEYESIYRMISSHTHGDVTSMLGGVVRGKAYHWPPERRAPSEMAISLVSGILSEASTRVCKKLKLSHSNFDRIVADGAMFH